MHTRLFICRGSTLLCLLVVGALFTGCQEDEGSGSFSSRGTASLSDRQLAQRYCAGCHQFPEPDQLRRSIWKDAILPRMGRRLGIFEGAAPRGNAFSQGSGGIRAQASPLFPSSPQLSDDEWDRIQQYFLENAPEASPAPPPHDSIQPGLEQFRVHEVPFQWQPAITSLVQIEDRRQHSRLYVGTVNPSSSTLTIFDREFSGLDTVRVRTVGAGLTAFSSVRRERDDLYLTEMGRLPPVEDSSGKYVRVSPSGSGHSVSTLLSGLKRPVQAVQADFDGDGREDDVAVAEFGSYTGQLAWHEKTEEGYQRHTLRAKPGAIRLEARDFTGNGHTDLLALFAQGDEGLFLYRNQGGGTFEEERLLGFPPSYGSSYFELADMNGDGAVDIVHVAGDNSDYRPVKMKPYHGIRIFLNDGQNNFSESYFYPLNGAYKAIPSDYDQDGDVDLAVISYFPDYDDSPEESFVYFENQGEETDSLSFVHRTFERPERGRWLVMDSGDLDGDGDQDLVLGSATGLGATSEYIPDSLHRYWSDKGPLVVFLENRENDSAQAQYSSMSSQR